MQRLRVRYIPSHFSAPVTAGQQVLTVRQVGSSYGLADYDWSNAKNVWSNNHPMNCEELLVEQAKLHKTVQPESKVFVYRNLVKALPWFTSVREKLEDPAYSGWFLKFKDGVNGSYHVPPCTYGICSELYHDQEQTPKYPSGCKEKCDCGTIPCGEYLWDHRNKSLTEFLINHYVGGTNGVDSPYIDGLFIDDGWSTNGPSEEDTHAVEDIGLTSDELQDVISGWQENMKQVQAKILASKSFNWQLLNCGHVPTTNNSCSSSPQTAPGRNQTDPKTDCIPWMRKYCKKDSDLQKMPLMFGFTRITHQQPAPLPAFEQDLATFLLVRGPYAWLGYGWQGCGDRYERPAAMDMDYGEPAGDCYEDPSQPGVFHREWTKASVSLDCPNWKGHITMK